MESLVLGKYELHMDLLMLEELPGSSPGKFPAGRLKVTHHL